jgi:hypothetical protein
MAYQDTPSVQAGYLLLPDGTRLALDSPAWVSWLEQAQRFSYASPATPYRFTLRREKRRHTWYWYAYLKYDAKLHNTYVGPSATLTTATLDAAGRRLAQQVARAHPHPPTESTHTVG